jgi:hypothetical protein
MRKYDFFTFFIEKSRTTLITVAAVAAYHIFIR